MLIQIYDCINMAQFRADIKLHKQKSLTDIQLALKR